MGTLWAFIVTVCVILLAVEMHIAAMTQQWADDERGPTKGWWDDDD